MLHDCTSKALKNRQKLIHSNKSQDTEGGNGFGLCEVGDIPVYWI